MNASAPVVDQVPGLAVSVDPSAAAPCTVGAATLEIAGASPCAHWPAGSATVLNRRLSTIASVFLSWSVWSETETKMLWAPPVIDVEAVRTAEDHARLIPAGAPAVTSGEFTVSGVLPAPTAKSSG